MNLAARIEQEFTASAEAKRQAAAVLAAPLAAAIEAMVQTLLADGKILACGNGESAADAQRFAAALVNRFDRARPPIAAFGLAADGTTLTALGNDSGFDAVFAKQVAALGRPGDILLALSASGNSPNLVAAVRAAHDHGVRVVALTGKTGGTLAEALGPDDLEIRVPGDRAPRIREIHVLALHCLCDGIDATLIGAEP